MGVGRATCQQRQVPVFDWTPPLYLEYGENILPESGGVCLEHKPFCLELCSLPEIQQCLDRQVAMLGSMESDYSLSEFTSTNFSCSGHNTDGTHTRG
jgi:hypothetical protein